MTGGNAFEPEPALHPAAGRNGQLVAHQRDSGIGRVVIALQLGGREKTPGAFRRLGGDCESPAGFVRQRQARPGDGLHLQRRRQLPAVDGAGFRARTPWSRISTAPSGKSVPVRRKLCTCPAYGAERSKAAVTQPPSSMSPAAAPRPSASGSAPVEPGRCCGRRRLGGTPSSVRLSVPGPRA